MDVKPPQPTINYKSKSVQSLSHQKAQPSTKEHQDDRELKIKHRIIIGLIAIVIMLVLVLLIRIVAIKIYLQYHRTLNLQILIRT